MTRHFQRWSREDDHLLRELWGKGTAIVKIAAKLQRKTPAVYARAKKCRLTSRPPLGFETFTAAARSGVQVPYLLRRLHKLGIRATKCRVKLLISEEQLQAALAIGPKNTLAGRKRAA